MTEVAEVFEVADAISSMLQAAPGECLPTEQIEHRLSKQARLRMDLALIILEREGTIERDGIFVRNIV